MQLQEKMQVINKKDIKQTGRMIMVYGETGCGKTTSILATAPDPILLILTEARSPHPSIEAANRPSLDLDIIYYTTWFELQEFLEDYKNVERYKTIVVDGYSHLMAVGISIELQDESYETKTKKEKDERPIFARTEFSLPSQGAMNKQIFRLTKRLGQFAQMGKIIIITCLLEEKPKWNRGLAAAPALVGREVPSNLPGFLDLIGMVQPRTDDEGNMIYPPLVRFEAPDNSFTAKFTGVKKNPKALAEGPLDFTKILNQKPQKKEE